MKYFNIVNKTETEIEIDIIGDIGFDIMKWFDGEKQSNTFEAIKNQLKEIANGDYKKIIVNINSPGGSLPEGLSIHDVFTETKAEVITRVYGMTASAATIIAQAGTTREMSDNALYLIHRASAGVGGNVNDIKEMLNTLEKADDRISNVYAKRSGKTKDFFIELMDRNNGNGEWLTSDEALEYGLIDKITEPSKLAASVNKGIFQQIKDKKLPEIPADKLIKLQIQNENKMKLLIKNSWNAIIKAFGFTKTDDDKVITKEGIEASFNEDNIVETLDKLNTDLENVGALNMTLEADKVTLTEKITNLETAQATISAQVTEKDTEIANLKAQITAKDSEIASLKAGKTTVTEIEDPTIQDTKIIEPNKEFIDTYNQKLNKKV